jgi:quercetin dioxygenase-like cupin family protein
MRRIRRDRQFGLISPCASLPWTKHHFHPNSRIVTVLSGTMYFGYGKKFDEKKMKALPVGSIWTEPANQPHFTWAKDGEVLIQIIGSGPSGVTPARP